MTLDNKVDANFYNLIHQLVDSEQSDGAAERRDQRRRPFMTDQRIAICQGREVPDESEFVKVRCHDLTRQGFSFFMPNRPDFDVLVAAFGSPPGMIYLAAEVAQCCDVLVYSSGVVQRMDDPATDVACKDLHGQTATPMVLVGCRFTHRLYG